MNGSVDGEAYNWAGNPREGLPWGEGIRYGSADGVSCDGEVSVAIPPEHAACEDHLWNAGIGRFVSCRSGDQ